MKREELKEILKGKCISDKSCESAIEDILNLHNFRLSLFQKNRIDLLNWAKSELKQETIYKLSKAMTPYRSDKIIFLRKIINWINNKD